MPRADSLELRRRDDILSLGRKVCTHCGLEKDTAEFNRNKSARDGLHYWCKGCIVESRNAVPGERRQRLDSLPVAPPDMKTCTKCGKVKARADFKKRKSAQDGLSWHCRNCERRAWLRRKEQDGITSGDIGALRGECRKRGQQFMLSTSQVRDWWKRTPDVCHYCGVNIEEYLELKEKLLMYDGTSRLLHAVRQQHFGKLREAARMTIDRRDNELGYVEGNLVKACVVCNMVKGGVLDEEEMLFVGPHLRRRLEAALGLNPEHKISNP